MNVKIETNGRAHGAMPVGSSEFVRQTADDSKTQVCKKCGEEKPLTQYKQHRKKCKECARKERNQRRQQNGYRDMMREYMNRYRKGNPEREMITIIKAVQKSGGLFMRHPGVLQIERIKRLISNDLQPDQVVMLKEELSICWKALDGSLPNDPKLSHGADNKKP
jgi:hypothetical protein